MDLLFRTAFNNAYTSQRYEAYRQRLERQVGLRIPFRLAETPLFLPAPLRNFLVRSAEEIVAQLCEPSLLPRLEASVPPVFRGTRSNGLADCLQLDFAIVRDADGSLTGRVVELQGFPSLYGFVLLQAEAFAEMMHGVPGLEQDWTPFFHEFDRTSYLTRLRDVILAACDPQEVVLLEIEPSQQKTYCDFIALKQFLDVDVVDPSELIRQGRLLFRKKNGRKIRVQRIFNRVVFDELERVSPHYTSLFSDDFDVTWVPHPHWYWMWSKYTLPFLHHPAVPTSRLLSDFWPPSSELSRYVLKPLFSFAGAGVHLDVDVETLQSIPAQERSQWILQEKVAYAPALRTPHGDYVKAEVRLMFLRDPQTGRLELVMNLARLARGPMLGVDHNKGYDWVGGTVSLWPR